VRVGWTSGGTQRFEGQFFEMGIYKGAMMDGEIGAVHTFLRERYGVGTCEDLVPGPMVNAVNGTCSGAATGDTCQFSCGSGSVEVSGTRSRRCEGSGYLTGAPLVCEAACPWDPAPDTPEDDAFALKQGCTRDLFALDFSTDVARTGKSL